ncbi:serine/threonine-protein kinase [Cellvibrio sp. QJXJ]|uniref:serine/threonine-protein kinase n=1 Tax=Cellvibrio sp. QJXJ TaxID=2964606 RepID=UPI0021C34BC1|nr:serine/threonine-protein kinase [Cellvibrio sp. QJXJ]UUA72014.1 protein kinase [Cellvibrio sp. QJXJ]
MDSKPHTTIPLQIGHYQVQEAIGRGGMGLVYRARDTRLEREVAIKCLRTELFEAHYIERFKREALLLAKLNHPNIVQIYDFIEAPDQLALVMELVDGQNLQTYLREHVTPLSQRLHWLTQIAEGLAIAHDAGIIHRDLKAENILINKRGQAKITDLGIAKSQDFNATLTDHVAGSYCSMSPEQAMGESISFKSDLFSLGILAYQLLCGAHPFGDTGNKLQIMQRIISHPPTPPHQHNPDLPAEFVDLLGQLLSKDPNKRPDNTHWVAAQFKKLSAMNVHDNIASDDTQALAMPHTNINKSITRSARTQDHPTFETRFAAVALPRVSPWKKIKNYIAANKIVVSSAALSVLMITGVIVWQLQPKPPKYIAVIPPKLTAEGMQESQQELVKLAVFDSIQQGILAIEDGYYLIPREEIIDTNGDIDNIRRATAADEIISTDINCKDDICRIALTRINADHSRLRTSHSKTFDVLTDNYLTMASLVYKNIELIYQQNSIAHHTQFTPSDYTTYLSTYQDYLLNGATPEGLSAIDSINNVSALIEAQTLYRDLALDLYYETSEPIYLEKFKRIVTSNQRKNAESTQHLINIFYLADAENDKKKAEDIIEQLRDRESNLGVVLSLEAYIELGKSNYKKAIAIYKKLLKIKPSATNYQNIAITYWQAGNLAEARKYLALALEKSPDSYKANQIHGAISLSEGDTKKAIASFNTAIKNRIDATNLSNLGLAYLLDNNFPQAAAKLQQANSLAPNNMVILLNFADALHHNNQKDSAFKKYRKIINSISSTSENPEELKAKILAHSHLGEHSQAIEHLLLLQKLDKENIDTPYTAAIVYTQANERTSALVNIKKALEEKIHPTWFNFSWFNSLCESTEFIKLMSAYGAPQRCTGERTN